MKRGLLNQRRVLVIAIVVLLITSLMGTSAAMVLTRIPRAIATTITTPFVHFVSWTTKGLRRSGTASITGAEGDQLQQMYQQALQYTRRLETELHMAETQIIELSGIRDALDTRDVRLVTARVVASSAARGAPHLLLSRGSRHGIEVGQTVTSGMNLVGRIVSVQPMTATVELLIQPEITLLARFAPVEPEPMPGAGLASLQLSDDGSSFVAVTGQTEPVHEQWLAHLADEAWPRTAMGTVIGRVTDIRPLATDPYLRQEVIVEPVTDLRRLNRVTVWTTEESGP